MQSASIPQGERNPRGYTEEEVLYELRGLRGSRKVSFRYEHLDEDLNRIKDLDNVIGGSITQSYTSAIKRYGEISLRGDAEIDFLHDYVKPWFRLHMPPQWTEESEYFDRAWNNSMAFPATGDADYDTLDSTGDAVELISGDLVHDGTNLYRNQNTLRMGDTGSSGGGYFVTPTMDLDGDLRRWQALMYFEDGANHQNIWRDDQGNFFGGWSSDETKSGFAVNGEFDQVFLAGVDQGSSLYNDLRDKWVRIEIDFDYTELKTYYRFYWTDPHRGTEPDFEHEAAIGYDERVSGVQVEKSNGTSGAVIYSSRVSLGDVDTLSPRPNPTENDFVEWPLGVFMMSTPVESSDGGIVTRDVEMFDRAKLFIDDKLTEPLVVTKGEVYTDIMNQLIDDTDPSIPRIIEPSDFVVGRTRQYDVGTEKKEVLDRLAEAIDYHTMQVDEDGVIVYRPYVSPDDRTPEFEYADNEISIMNDDVEKEFDIYEIANVWIVSLSETEGDPVTVKLENQDPANPFSVPRRGRRIVDYREQEEGVDPNTIMRKAKRIQFEANRQFEGVDFFTLLNPLHSVNDCYTVNFGDLNVSNKYTETYWTMPLQAGGRMEHRSRRNVNLNPELFDGFVDDHLQVNGSLTAGNIAWGKVTVPITKVNTPQSVSVTGLSLKGTGRVEVFVTAESTVPQHVKGVTSMSETPSGFTVWMYKATSPDVDVHWLALRKV